MFSSVDHDSNFVNNDIQANDHGFGSIWDNGCEGNYWSNYNGTDLDVMVLVTLNCLGKVLTTIL